MKTLIQFKTTPPLLVTLTLLCFGLLSGAQAVSPEPDGGYPGFTTAEGQNALKNLTTGQANTALGWFSLFSATTGSFNTGVGAGALALNTGDSNTAVGAAALLLNTGIQNTATGASALRNNTTAEGNTADGYQALFSNTTGENNTATGLSALKNTTGSGNTAVGVGALFNNTNGNDNTAYGIGAGGGVMTADNVICIGSFGGDVSNSCFIGNIHGVTTAINDAIPVLIDSAGQLGTSSSSRRYKTDIKPMDKESECILALKPVTFHYKSDAKNTPCFGLIAEEVAEVNPDLVVRNKDGDIYTVRYDQVNAMLLNEFLKAHSQVEQQESRTREQEATISEMKANAATQDTKIARQEEQIEALTAGLQKVSAQLAAASPSDGGLDLSKTASQTVCLPAARSRTHSE